jgi:hypothetical protein
MNNYISNESREYVRIHDPGHSWLAVPVHDVMAVDALDHITVYSPQRNGMIYLEEDCDLHTFYQACLVRAVNVSWVNVDVDDFDEYLKTV